MREKGGQRSRRGETDAHLTHWSLESLCSPQRWGERRISYQFVSLPCAWVSACVHLCACILVGLYVNMRVGESATMISVELGHWAGGCTQWICLSREFFSLNQPEWRLLFIFLRVNHPRVSDRTLKRAWQVCLSEITVWCVCMNQGQKTRCMDVTAHVCFSMCVLPSLWFHFDSWLKRDLWATMKRSAVSAVNT